MFEVIVGNVGTVYRGETESYALDTFAEYVSMSKLNIGRAGNESVMLFKEGEIMREHYVPDEQDEHNRILEFFANP